MSGTEHSTSIHEKTGSGGEAQIDSLYRRAAGLYGVGARLDEKPALLFQLRGVDETQLLANAGQELSLKKAIPAKSKVLDDSDVAALFGLEMAETVTGDTAVSRGLPQQTKRSTGPKTHAGKKTVAYKEGKRKRASRQVTQSTPPNALNQRNRSKQPRVN